jgi:Ca-activated chloride channel family protein
MIFLNPLLFFLLPIPVLLWLYLRSTLAENRAWRAQWNSSGPKLEFLRPWLLAAASLFLIVAMARPVWSPREISSSGMGQDTVFLVDVSKSMDTVDFNGTSRLEAVKRALMDLTPEVANDRVALVAFAGTTVVKCPLTTDVSFFKQSVELLDTGSASRGGTLMGDALRQVAKDFSEKNGNLSLWVFTDGGDQESFPVEAAGDLGTQGISLNIWGVGSLAGGAVPERGVSSALNETLLKSVAQASGNGAYFGIDKPLWQLAAEYGKRHRASSLHQSSTTVWQEGSWYLVWPALLCVVFEMSIGIRITRRRLP